MQFTHTLQNGKILNVLCLDFIRQRIVVDTLAGLMLIGISRKRNVFGNDHIDFLLHLLDLSVSKGLNTEVVIFLDLIIHKITCKVRAILCLHKHRRTAAGIMQIVAAVELSNDVAIHNLIAAEF